MKGLTVLLLCGLLVLVKATDREVMEKLMAMMKEHSVKSMYEENMEKQSAEEVSPTEPEMAPGAPMEEPIEMPDALPEPELNMEMPDVLPEPELYMGSSESSGSESSSEESEDEGDLTIDATGTSLVYHGQFRERCGADGLYYRDRLSFVVCSNGQAVVQPCAYGSSNHELREYNVREAYFPKAFCGLNYANPAYSGGYHHRYYHHYPYYHGYYHRSVQPYYYGNPFYYNFGHYKSYYQTSGSSSHEETSMTSQNSYDSSDVAEGSA